MLSFVSLSNSLLPDDDSSLTCRASFTSIKLCRSAVSRRAAMADLAAKRACEACARPRQ